MQTLFKSAHFELLCLAITTGDEQEAIKKAEDIIKSQIINWDELYERADMHVVKPQLGRLLNNISLPLVPASILKNLEVANRENLYRQLQNVAEYLQIKKQLDEVGVPAIPFKGFWLANQFYGNLADRESVDVDLFIRVSDLEKVKQVMFGRKYVAEEPLPRLTSDYIVNELCEYNFDKYTGDTRSFHFEFHWRISMNVYGLNINFNELEPQITAGDLQHTKLDVFNPSANLLLAVMHHAGKDHLSLLRQVLDISCILKKQGDIDWDWVVSKAQKYQMEKMLYITIKTASLVTGAGIPAAISGKVNSKFIARLATNRIRSMEEKITWENTVKRSLANFYFQLQSRNSTTLRIRLILYEIRTAVLPNLVPQTFRRYFLNKKIRIKPGTKSI